MPGPRAVGVAVIRLSGSQALTALQRITLRPRSPSLSSSSSSSSSLEKENLTSKKLKNFKNFEPRQATMCSVYDPETGDIVDARVLGIYFPGPKSFTRIYICICLSLCLCLCVSVSLSVCVCV